MTRAPRATWTEPAKDTTVPLSRELGAVNPPATVTIDQGIELGRPSLLTVTIPVAGGISVAGTAVPIG